MKKLLDVVLVGLVLTLIYTYLTSGGGVIPIITPNPPVVTEDFPAPRGKFVSVPDVSAYVSGDTALELAWFWKNFAEQLKEDSFITNVRMARNLHAYAGRILRKNSPSSLYRRELSVKLEDFFVKMVGLEVQELTPELRDDVVRSFNAIAWTHYKASLVSSPSIAAQGIEKTWENSFAITHGCIMDVGSQDFMLGLLDIGVAIPEEFKDDFAPRGPPKDDAILNGLIFEDGKSREFLDNLPKFDEFGFSGLGAGNTRLLYESLEKFDPGAFSERQVTSDCVSFAARNAADVARAFEIDVQGDPEDFIVRGATEPIYGMRGHPSGGMAVSTAAKFLNQSGGIALRKKYPSVDLSVYDANKGVRWGGSREGTPEDLRRILQDNQVQKVSLITNVQDARDAIFSGYPLVVGSGYSFSSTRDQYGFAKRTPRGWRHAMAWVATAPAKDLMGAEELQEYLDGGYSQHVSLEEAKQIFDEGVEMPEDWPPSEVRRVVRDPDDPCFLIVNSWGPWNNGPRGKYKIPEGSFWVTAEIAAGMIGQRQAIAVGNCQGFSPLPLEDWGFAPWLGVENLDVLNYEPDTFIPSLAQ